MDAILKITTILLFCFAAANMVYALDPKNKSALEKLINSGVALVSVMCIAAMWGVF